MLDCQADPLPETYFYDPPDEREQLVGGPQAAGQQGSKR